MSEAIYKFEPHRTIYLRGFDRRGCAAALHSASAGGFTVSGVFRDLADFVVVTLFDADDNYGHLTTTRYLPDFDLTGLVVGFDLAVTNGMYPGSTKFPSVPWGSLSWITSDGTSGTTALNITSTTGEVAATATFTVAGTPTNFDRIQIVYLGNVVFDLAGLITTGMTLAQVAAAMASAINAATSSTVPLTATSSGANITISCTQPGQDGNTIELLSMYKTAGNTTISPAVAKMTGGVDPTSFHVKLDLSAMIPTVLGRCLARQCWLTLAPSLPIDSGGVNATLVPFTAKEFEYVFSNWTLTDPDTVSPLKVAGPGSVVVGAKDLWASFAGSGWSLRASSGAGESNYYRGFAKVSATAGDSVTIFYSCQSTHNLYLGTLLAPGGGIFTVTVDGIAQANLDTYLDTPISARRLIATGIAAGEHTVVLTVDSAHNAASSGWNCYFDYLHAAVLSDVEAAAVTYANVNAACDFDTGQTYQISPARAVWILQHLGFTGDLDFYAGVFFALNRARNGGSFHQVTVTLSGSTPGIGNSFGSGSDTLFITLGGVTTGGTAISGETTTGGSTTGGTAFGIAVFPADTISTIAQRAVDGLNGLFVGVCAALTGTAGQFTITVLSPINGFVLNLAYTATAGSNVTMAVSGDIGVAGGAGGQEGTWGVDDSVITSSPAGVPLNRAFVDYLTDLAGILQAAGQTMTVAFSQELLAPPDVNTSSGAWSQRFADGTAVLTDTGFGEWGAGFVEGVSSGTYQQTGHGYITGNTAHFASGSGSGAWSLMVTDANHYTLGADLANSGGYTPGVGDSVFIDLQTSQCGFNSLTVTPYLQACYVQAAQILAGAGLVPWLQFGEILHWFFSETMTVPITGMANSGGLIEFATTLPHGLTNGQTAIVAGAPAGSGTRAAAVIDSTHFTNGASWPGGSPAAAGTVSGGGGMAFYDANQTAAAVVALGRGLGTYWTQDDTPNSSDAVFLAGRIYSHISTIVAAVLAVESTAKFELLYPLDVNLPSCYYTAVFPYPQGGLLNAAVNLPAQFVAKGGSGLNRLKMEGLSWQSQYANQDLCVETARFPYSVLGWAKADTALLIAWDDGLCPWQRAYVFFANEGIPLVNLWAVDHAILFSWPAGLPANQPGVSR